MLDVFFRNIDREDVIRIFGRIDREGVPGWAGSEDQYVMYEAEIYPVMLVLSRLYQEYHKEKPVKRQFDKTMFADFIWRLRELDFVTIRREDMDEEEGLIARDNESPVRRGGKTKTTLSFADLSGFLTQSHLHLPEHLLARFVTSLLAKPFVILTGLSGSGKTRLAHLFARWICEKESQICLVPVGADWTNREALLGYPNALEQGRYVQPDHGVLNLLIEATRPYNRQRPYFLILDEMNLSHVERYFADFLSVMESGGSIPLHPKGEEWQDCPVPASVHFPDNLFVIGTVNVDETTYMFSPKVLDRAHVIEFRITPEEMKAYLSNPQRITPEAVSRRGVSLAAAFVGRARRTEEIQMEELSATLFSFFSELRKVGAEFGYRTASEIGRFVSQGQMLRPDWSIDDLTDAAVMQRLLPRLHGARRRLEPVLRTLAMLCLSEEEAVEPYLGEIRSVAEGVAAGKVRYPLSLDKIVRMHRAAMENGFAGYPEA